MNNQSTRKAEVQVKPEVFGKSLPSQGNPKVHQRSIAISSSFPRSKSLLQAKSRGFDQVIQEYPKSSIAPGPLHRYPFFILAASSIQASQYSELIGD
ncbi:hypothetical protein PGT21_017350 [Puccinia graminis f. sp. tritici]|nr:hypothetical protein PGT21_017350 [Puccinia graminis f. sp. tritici]